MTYFFVGLVNILAVIGLYYLISFISKSNRDSKKNYEQYLKNQEEYNKPESIFKRESENLGYNLQELTKSSHYPYIILPSITEKNKALLPEQHKWEYDEITEEDKTDLPKVGRSEYILEDKLIKKYGTNYIITGVNYNLNGFYPDISYINKKEKIFLDIEIDEPYDLKTQSPIHYKDKIQKDGRFEVCDKNSYRDSIFKGYGWTVIRFSEDQVLLQTDKCLEIINYVIEYWKRNYTAEKITDATINRDKRWNIEEVANLVLKQHRDVKYQEYLNFQSKAVDEEFILLSLPSFVTPKRNYKNNMG